VNVEIKSVPPAFLTASSLKRRSRLAPSLGAITCMFLTMFSPVERLAVGEQLVLLRLLEELDAL
jgi:hypothetical protein